METKRLDIRQDRIMIYDCFHMRIFHFVGLAVGFTRLTGVIQDSGNMIRDLIQQIASASSGAYIELAWDTASNMDCWYAPAIGISL